MSYQTDAPRMPDGSHRPSLWLGPADEVRTIASHIEQTLKYSDRPIHGYQNAQNKAILRSREIVCRMNTNRITSAAALRQMRKLRKWVENYDDSEPKQRPIDFGLFEPDLFSQLEPSDRGSDI